MSYILEALKRSQEEHSRGQVPTLATEVPSKPLRRSWWKILVLGVLVIGAGGVLVAAYQRFLQPTELTATPPKESHQSSAVVSESGQAGAAAKTETPPAAATPQAKPEPRLRNRVAAEPKGAGEAGGTKPARRPSAEANPAEGQIMQSLRAETESMQDNLRRLVNEAQSQVPQTTPPPEPKKKIPIFGEKPPAPSPPPSAPRPVGTSLPQPGPAAVAEVTTGEDKSALPPLPPEVEAALPQIRLLAHVYRDEAEKRFVILNGQKLGEGQTTRDGLLVESIQPDGVRLGFRGHSLYRSR